MERKSSWFCGSKAATPSSMHGRSSGMLCFTRSLQVSGTMNASGWMPK